MTITILKPGLLTTVQDLGRFGSQQYGVIVSGAMDSLSYRIGNMLLGQTHEAALEITLLGPTISFQSNTVIALTGANFNPLLDGVPCPMWRPVPVNAGSILKMQSSQIGARGYICIKGGIQVEPVLGSRSTYLRAQLGGFQGRALMRGDVLSISSINNDTFHEQWPTTSSVDYTQFLIFSNEITVRIIPGTEYDEFTEDSKQTLVSTPFTITKEADRMGYRLHNDHCELVKNRSFDLLSEAVTFGTVQVPPNGQPIILMADRQTTGGYPKIAQVISADLPKLAQLQPFSHIRFEMVSLAEAQQLFIEQEKKLKLLKTSIQAVKNR